jgi:hypothetical protein
MCRPDLITGYNRRVKAFPNWIIFFKSEQFYYSIKFLLFVGNYVFMSSDGLIIVVGIVFAFVLTALSLNVMPSAFWDYPFLVVLVFCGAVFTFWLGAYNTLVKKVKR